MGVQYTEEEQAQMAENALRFIVMHTPYSAQQAFRVIELVAKWGKKARYHMTKKQNDILDFYEAAIEIQMRTLA